MATCIKEKIYYFFQLNNIKVNVNQCTQFGEMTIIKINNTKLPEIKVRNERQKNKQIDELHSANIC